MQIIDIQQLHHLFHQLNGSPAMLSENGETVAVIVPYSKTVSKEPRKPGLFAGQIVMHDNFDDPMPEEFLRAFE